MRLNSFTMDHDEPRPEILLSFDERSDYRPHLKLGDFDTLRRVGLGVNGIRETLPAFDGNRLLSAAAVRTVEGKPRLVKCQREDPSVLLRVIATRLSFPYPRMMGSVYWAGGETLNGPWLQAGGDSRRNKDQLFVLKPGEFIFVIDTLGGVARVDHGIPKPRMQQADPKEFADYVASYSLSKVRREYRDIRRRHADARWGVSTLSALGQPGLADPILQAWQRVCQSHAAAAGLPPIAS